MNKPNMAKFFKRTQKVLSDRSPEILTGLGIAGMITTTVLAVRATPKALKLIDEAKREAHVDKLAPIDTVKAAWKCYIPATVTGVASVACLIGASSVHLKRNAALATAYKLSETALIEYKDKVVETIGEKKEQVIREKIHEDHIAKNPVSKNEVAMTKRGSTLCYDYMSGRWFMSDIDMLKKAENEINKRMLHDMFGYASLNEFYDELGLDRVGMGEDIGWNVHNLIDLFLDSKISDDGRPCIVVAFHNAPTRNFDKVM